MTQLAAVPHLKTLNATEGRVGGYLVVWGSAQRRDLQGEYFTPQTELGLDWYDRRPVLYHHGLDGDLKAAVIGLIDTLRADEIGVWAEAQLDMRQRYVRAVHRLIERGILGWSSGSLPHLVEVTDDGCIRRWPIVEGSLTPAPAEPRRTDARVIKSAYDALGLDTAKLGLSKSKQQPYSHRSFKGANTMQDEMIPVSDTERAPRKRLPLSSGDAVKASITVGSPYDRLDALDMLHGYVLLRSTKNFHGVSERYANALAHKVRQKNLTAMKADELSRSTLAGFGDEWVPDLWSASTAWRTSAQTSVDIADNAGVTDDQPDVTQKRVKLLVDHNWRLRPEFINALRGNIIENALLNVMLRGMLLELAFFCLQVFSGAQQIVFGGTDALAIVQAQVRVGFQRFLNEPVQACLQSRDGAA